MTPDWSRFSRKFVAVCEPCRDRIPSLRRELARVGLRPDEVDGTVDAEMRCHGTSLAHYEMYRRFLDGKGDMCLCLEDDVRFLRDTEKLARVVAEMPDDADLAHLSWCSALKGRAGVSWSPAPYDTATCGTAAYAVSRRAAERLLDRSKGHLADFLAIDLCPAVDLDGSFKTYFATPPCASVASYAAHTSGNDSVGVFQRCAARFGLPVSAFGE